MNIRKLPFAIVVAGALLAFVASCTKPTPAPAEAPTEAPAAASPERLTSAPLAPTYDQTVYGDLENLNPNGQTVVYWYQHTRSREELLLSMIDEFNRTNEWHLTVQGESHGSYDKLYQKIIAGIPEKQLPSMAVAYQDQAAIYAGQGALVALDPYVESEKWGYTEEELVGFFPVALGADYLPQFEARYGWPLYKSMEVMYYNEDWLAELGYGGPPETWGEFAEMTCKAIEQPFSGATGEGAYLGYEYTIDASRFATLVFSRGGNIVNENGTGYVFNGPEGLAALTFLKDLVDRGCAAEATESYGDQTDFGVGRVLFTISSISGLPHYKQAVDQGAGFKWSVAPPPHSTDRAAPRMNIYGASQSIFVSTPEEQLAAWLFIKWMSEPKQQATWAGGTGYYPIRQTAADLLADYFAQTPTYQKVFSFMLYDYGTEAPVTGYDQCRVAIVEMFRACMGGADAQTQLDSTVEMCNQYLKEAAPG